MDNRKFDWVIILRKGNSHAKGLQVCKKVYDIPICMVIGM